MLMVIFLGLSFGLGKGVISTLSMPLALSPTTTPLPIGNVVLPFVMKDPPV